MSAETPPVAEAASPSVIAAANCLRIMGHPSRLAIAALLLEGPCAVSVMESRLKLRQPNLSQHLGLLRDANLLVSRRQAKAVVYELADGVVRELVSSIARLFGLGQTAAVLPGTAGASAQAIESSRAVAQSPVSLHRETGEASVFARMVPDTRDRS
ncbi:metalloregulator ArsR/SmtB family transcription factor [Achromobacter marplatensis]|uniref:ArsR/SmtB family transcription factor n=1 Tax=Achromobacter marplatensis TaxID=470868 RepID=UPI0028EF9363|nr:metalloregulator ArsR/SmtB family transcription factor [Achromobacter marplatensis]